MTCADLGSVFAQSSPDHMEARAPAGMPCRARPILNNDFLVCDPFPQSMPGASLPKQDVETAPVHGVDSESDDVPGKMQPGLDVESASGGETLVNGVDSELEDVLVGAALAVNLFYQR